MRNTAADWERFGALDPYFGVVTNEKYHRQNLDEKAIAEFFESGRVHVDFLLKAIRRYLDPAFSPQRTLDFGCGVGRVAIPLASICERVVGTDISDSMLAEARKNCAARGVSNVELLKCDDQLSGISGPFDFIHSFIVFQHIPCKRGEAMLRRITELLTDDGVGVLHFAYYRRASRVRKLVSWSRKRVPFVHNLLNLVQGRGLRYPAMQMNAYDLNRLFLILQETGCRHCHLRFTDHSGHLGVLLFLQKKALEPTPQILEYGSHV